MRWLSATQSLAHPGGNLTGQTILSTDVIGKRLQMLLEIVPDPGCVAVLGLAGVDYDRASHELATAAKALGVPLLPITVADVNDLATRIAEITRHQCRALVAMSEPLFVQESRQLIELAGQYRIAASYDNRLIVDAGGLMSYGPDTVDMFRRAARYVDKILKGEKPADLPIEQPTKFVLAINLKTAKALGLTVPPSILARADEVIECVGAVPFCSCGIITADPRTGPSQADRCGDALICSEDRNASGILLTLDTRPPPRHARESGHPERPTPGVWFWTPAFAGVTEEGTAGVNCLVPTTRRLLPWFR
jgi:hypothetical protein